MPPFKKNSLICLTKFSFSLWLRLLINLCKHGDVDRNSAEKQLKGSLWLFFPFTKSIEITKPAVASLFNNFLFISWFLTQFLLLSSFLGSLDSLFAISVHMLLWNNHMWIYVGVCPENWFPWPALITDGSQCDKDWGKRWREINKKDALPVSSIMFNNVLKLYILFLIKNKYFSKKAPCVVRHKRAVLR